MSSSSGTPPDTIMVSDASIEQHSNGDNHATETSAGGNSSVPKPKRLACMICRKRKLKCDGIKPSCSTCSRLGHTCAYDEIRRKSGPKRGYVKALEERLKQVETMLKTQDVSTPSPDASKSLPVAADSAAKQPNQRAAATANFHVTDPSIAIASSRDQDRWHFNAESPNELINDFNFNTNMSMGLNTVESNFTWEMIGLGLEEPLPPQETIDELHQIYFEKIHPSLPMIHKYRYLAAMNLAPSQRPPVCLRYAMWTLASSVTDKYQNLKDLFYQRARKYVESDYIKGYGEHLISVAHAQTHVLLGSYEFKWMYFPRAWMSTGSAVRLSQMIGLHRLDGAGLDVKQCLPAPRDWTEREERRRTFWMAFCQDRYASIGTGWPMTVDEKDIFTNLPSSEEAFEMSRPEQTLPLQDAMSPVGAGKLSAFGGIVLMACLFGRNLVHLHRPDVDDRDHDLNGEFWKRHRSLDNILLNTSLCLPGHLKLPSGLGSPNIVFTNMCIHTSTICLHQAAIFKADKNRLPATVSSESKVRCITAANEIASIMRMISHLDLAAMNPFISFCLYVAARVFVQYLKSRPDDSQTSDSLKFLLSAMNALKRRNPLTESFLVQLDVDLEALGVRIPKFKAAFPRSSDSPAATPPATGRAVCDLGEAGAGIVASSENMNIFRPTDNNMNPAGTPEGADVDTENPGAQASGLPNRKRSGGATYLPVHGLLPNDVGNMGGIPHDVGHMSGFTMGGPNSHDRDTGSSNGMSGTSPEGGQSMRTPNSSTASDSRNKLAPGGISSRNSFEASPVPSHQNLNMSGASQSEVERNVNAFFNSPFNIQPGVSTGLAPDQRYSMPDTPGGGDFSMPQGWGDLSGQQGMTPVAEGVYRSIMAMGPLETMGLAWGESNQDGPL
ncbi:fungal-specific transcription factor domain-containing protein [Podospora appendiculata]|uniref:Fungal-specific transcription factor domain-containing protein n=1 Tax=Podospora appendiculata TaxID=314037 RepID=A0AAE0XJQ4_9PEZI|nr:fungal-specific transcription factor domain-containing protein [Podospora appendiculata]